MTTEQLPPTGTPVSGPGPWRVRVLALDAAPDMAAELQRMGVPPGEAAAIAGEAHLRLVKLDAIREHAAEALRREAPRCGVRAVVSSRSVTGGTGARDCLLAGTTAGLREMRGRLNRTPDLGGAGAEIERALHAYENPLAGELRCRGRNVPLGQRTLVMGVINATPDSFSGDGLAGDVGAMVARGEEMAAQGADFIDIGGESTRPGADAVEVETERARVLPVIHRLYDRVEIPISIDTRKPEVARAALDAGASVINDVSGLRGDAGRCAACGMAQVAAACSVPVIVMHMQGAPKTMQHAPHYDDLLGEIAAHLMQSVELAQRAGVPRDQVVIDPGFGFGKTVNHNLEIVRRLRELKSLGQPLLVGPSRKSTIGKVLDLPADERVEGTLAVVALAVGNGADIVRVHDVAAAVRVARMTDAVLRGWAEQ